jgi:Recombinase
VRLGRNAERLAPANHTAAVGRADQIKGIMAELVATGFSTRRIAEELTARGIATPRGGRWHPQTVKRVMERVSTVARAKSVARGSGLKFANR